MAARITKGSGYWAQQSLRLVLIVAAVSYAFLAIGNGLDRAVMKTPRLLPYVPDWFEVKALAIRSSLALAKHRGAAAQSLAEQAVARAAVDPSSTALLGAARLINNDALGADAAFRVAGQFGWRERLTQIYWMKVALSQRDYQVATQRLDAILRQYPEMLADRSLLDDVERNPDARAALVARLRDNPGWLPHYTMEVESLSSDIMQLRGEVLDELAASNRRVGCERIAPSVRALARFGSAGFAAKLWREHCPDAGNSMITDGHFARTRMLAPLTQFEWSLEGDGELGLSIEPGRDGSDQQLSISSRAQLRRSFVMQQISVPPGAYVLRWLAHDPDGKPSARISATLVCELGNRDWQPGQFDSRSGSWYLTVVVGNDCQGHWLEFAVAPGSSDVLFDDVSLEPAS